jgi:hypothetical protein
MYVSNVLYTLLFGREQCGRVRNLIISISKHASKKEGCKESSKEGNQEGCKEGCKEDRKAKDSSKA